MESIKLGYIKRLSTNHQYQQVLSIYYRIHLEWPIAISLYTLLGLGSIDSTDLSLLYLEVIDRIPHNNPTWLPRSGGLLLLGAALAGHDYVYVYSFP